MSEKDITAEETDEQKEEDRLITYRFLADDLAAGIDNYKARILRCKARQYELTEDVRLHQDAIDAALKERVTLENEVRTLAGALEQTLTVQKTLSQPPKQA